MASPHPLSPSELCSTGMVSETFPIFALCSKATGTSESGNTLQSLLGASQEAHLDALSRDPRNSNISV